MERKMIQVNSEKKCCCHAYHVGHVCHVCCNCFIFELEKQYYGGRHLEDKISLRMFLTKLGFRSPLAQKGKLSAKRKLLKCISKAYICIYMLFKSV